MQLVQMFHSVVPSGLVPEHPGSWPSWRTSAGPLSRLLGVLALKRHLGRAEQQQVPAAARLQPSTRPVGQKRATCHAASPELHLLHVQLPGGRSLGGGRGCHQLEPQVVADSVPAVRPRPPVATPQHCRAIAHVPSRRQGPQSGSGLLAQQLRPGCLCRWQQAQVHSQSALARAIFRERVPGSGHEWAC